MALEYDPADGKIDFMYTQLEGFKFEGLKDIYLALGGLAKAAAQASEQAGHTVYPIWELI